MPPVRIELDAKELAEHPLRVGLSMQVKVDVASAGGDGKGAPIVSAAPRTVPAYQTRVFEFAGKEAQALIARIIAANGGNGGNG